MLTLVGFITGYIGVTLFADFMEAAERNLLSWETAVLLVLVVPFLYLAIFLHELGHLLAGLAVGFRLMIFQVGPIRVYRKASGAITIGYKPIPGLALGGLSPCEPLGEQNLRQRIFMHILGGPAASFVFGLILFSFGLLATFNFTNMSSVDFWALLMAWFYLSTGALSVIVGFIALLPGSDGKFETDGYLLRRVYADSDLGRQKAASVAIGLLTIGGKRPRDYPEFLISLATAVYDGSYQARLAALQALAHAMDLGDLERARDLLETRVLPEGLDEVMPKPILDLTYATATYFYGRHEGNPELARTYLAKTGDCITDPASKHLAIAATKFAESKMEEAHKAALEAKKRIADNLLGLELEDVREVIDEMLRLTDPHQVGKLII